MERHCELSDEEEFLAFLRSFEEPPLFADNGRFADEEELMAGILGTLDRTRQREFMKPIVADQAQVDAEQFIADADPAFGQLIDTNRHEQVRRRSMNWASRLDDELNAAMDQWYEEQLRSSVARLGYGYLLQTENAGRVCWQKEGF